MVLMETLGTIDVFPLFILYKSGRKIRTLGPEDLLGEQRSQYWVGHMVLLGQVEPVRKK